MIGVVTQALNKMLYIWFAVAFVTGKYVLQNYVKKKELCFFRNTSTDKDNRRIYFYINKTLFYNPYIFLNGLFLISSYL